MIDRANGANLSFESKVAQLKKKYPLLSSSEEKYTEIIRMGRELSPFPPERCTENHLVQGCQSRLYLYTWMEQGKIFFTAQADALISAGLAALLIAVYSGESPDIVLKNPPNFLHELGIHASLSLNRSSRFSHIHLPIKQNLIKFLLPSVTGSYFLKKT